MAGPGTIFLFSEEKETQLEVLYFGKFLWLLIGIFLGIANRCVRFAIFIFHWAVVI